jgi:hypothetical protein
MNRILAAGAAATAAAGAAALAVTIGWTGIAAAAPGHPAKAESAKPAAARQDPPPPLTFASSYRGGQYVTVVKCSGGATPPPLHLGTAAAPLTLSGSGPSTSAMKSASVPTAFKPAYLCTILVEKRLPAPPARKVPKKAVIETGFGGMAGAVARHHPRR